MFKYFALALLLPIYASAYSVIETDVSQPYDIVPIEVVAPEQISYLGTLEEYPVMYEVTSEDSFVFEAQLWQWAGSEPEPLVMLLIRKNDRGGGVSEVTRMTIEPAEWEYRKDSKLGMSFLVSPAIQEEVEAGTYRLEVSSPDNQARYLLQVGSESPEVGYFAELGAIRQTQAYFGQSIFSMLKSSYVYYPIGILLLLGAIYQTARFARRRNHPADAA